GSRSTRGVEDIAPKGALVIDYRGTLGEALHEIAAKGHINLIATGDLHQSAEVHLTNVTPDEALEALVKVHHLELHKEGKLWVVKPADAAPLPPLPPVPQALPPLKAVPALPPAPGGASEPSTPEAIEAEGEAA